MKQNPSHLSAVFLNRTRNTRIERIFTDFLPHPDPLLKGEGVVPCVPRLFVGEGRRTATG